MFLATLLLLARLPAGAATQYPIGFTASGHMIQASIAGATNGSLSRVLIIGGLDGSQQSAAAVTREFARFQSTRQRYVLAAIPLANPGNSSLAFPPAGDAYRENSEAHSLWRWIGVWAPDLVIVVGADPGGLAPALSHAKVAGIGAIPARRVDAGTEILRRITVPKSHSEARMELDRRAVRTPLQLARQMEIPYGHELKEAVYIPAVALMARLRLGQRQDVERIVYPYLSGDRNSLAKPTASHLSGHLLFADLADLTGDKRYAALAIAAADMGFDDRGSMRESMPFHSRMSDSVFMGCPILVRAWTLTRDPKYLDMALRHFRFMQSLDERPDGLWRHSPKAEAAWGRGNGFAILGLALSLSYLPTDHPAFVPMRDAFRNLAAALRRHQDETGMWRQVIDLPGSYRELSATCIIGFALTRGVRRGWIEPATYQPAIDRAWNAVNLRVSPTGELIDVCESTGAQNNLADYLRRKAILGSDPRGGAMVLLFATERAGL